MHKLKAIKWMDNVIQHADSEVDNRTNDALS